MTSAFTDPRSPGPRPGRGRPQIWAGGKRRSGLSAGVLWRHAREGARGWAIPRLDRLAARAARSGEAVAAGAGAAAVARLGRAAVVLPPRRHVAGLLAGIGRLSAQAARVLAGPPPVEPLPLRPWAGARGAAPAATPPAATPPAATPLAATPPAATPAPPPQPAALSAAPPQPAASGQPAPSAAAVPPPRRLPPEPLEDTDRPILEAIRKAIRSPVAPQHPDRGPQRAAQPPRPPRGRAALPELAPPEPPEPGPALRLAARAVALVAQALALPVGAVLTLRAVLRGEGLED
jgi:hypothetical protein